jgi:transglutaminase-like putative cysteine protease
MTVRAKICFALLAMWAALLGTACNPPANGDTPGKVPPANAAAVADPIAAAVADAKQEVWDALYIDGAKVGYAHTTVTPVVEEGQQLLRTDHESEVTVKRFGQTVTQKLEFSSTEKPAGQLVHFTSEMKSGTAPVITRGHLQDGLLVLELQTQGAKKSSAIDWKPDWGGFSAAEQSLERKPLEPGEERVLQALMPVVNQVGEVRLKAIDYETTRMLMGTAELLKIERSDMLAGTKIESIMWTNRDGEALKTLVPGLNQESYRTTREVALSENKETDFDLGEATAIHVTRRLNHPHQTRRIVYRARLKDGDPKSAFVSGPTQSVKAIDEHTAEVTVRAIRPNDPAQLDPPDTPPTADDLASNNMIQSDDRRVVELANQVAPNEKDSWKLAQQLEAFVRRSVRIRSFSPALSTAAEVAQSLEGDCTENAMLLAALCRAREIPARVAIGLVYYPTGTGGGYAYHMWTEVWIADRWVPLDATLGHGGIGAAHLKLAQTNLKGANAYAAFLPVFPVLRRLELEIVDVQ